MKPSTIRWAVAGLLALCLVLVLQEFNAALETGGSAFQQADWLINSAGGRVRRDFSGDTILFVADALAMSPLTIVAILQGCIALLVFVLLFCICLRQELSVLAGLMIVSPLASPVFWAGGLGAFRKEALVVAALILLLLPVRRKPFSALCVGASLVLFGLGCFAHEALVVLLPALLVVFAISHAPGRVELTIFALIASGIAVTATWYAFTFRTVPDGSPMCQALLDRGLDEDLCSGLIRFMELTLWENIERVVQGNLLSISAVGFVLSAAPAIYVLWRLSARLAPGTEVLRYVGVATIPVLPLYILASDWGRWLSLQGTCFVFLCLAGLARGRLSLRSPVPAGLAVAALSLGFICVPAHTTGVEIGGLSERLVSIALTGFSEE